ncbi:response regulator transcription factor [Iningainema tapete]|uniref:Response regulator transcription factor n=1 Tax=Iningainema tapete BLCC-T55 TaxID=2748662 RepID=A0A8J6XNV8_9CYAN|nr:response regulator transcription factor [Iningainema tapete]MBD2776501.1 response regulator transcription factor [Iningainema tapete BLCC-T55]
MHSPVTNNKQKILVVDDQELVLHATVNVLIQHYPEAEIVQAQTSTAALNQVATIKPDLVVVDLAMPHSSGETARTENGIMLIKTLMQQYPTLNIVVQSMFPRALVRLKPAISLHEGGFTVADKSQSIEELLTKVEWAFRGVIYTPKEMRAALEVKPEWLDMLQMAYNEGLQDTIIAERLNVAQRTVRYYWQKIQDELGVYPDAGKNLRIQTEIRAREEGLID